jgi:fatty acid desaturase
VPQASPPKFARDEGFREELKRRVGDCFRLTGVSPHAGGRMYFKHHLFPKVCHVHYPRISEIVEAVCAEFGVSYHAHDKLRGAISSHWRFLRRMGLPDRYPTPA